MKLVESVIIMANIGPLSNNSLLVYKTQLNNSPNIQGNDTSKSSALFVQLLEQALLQAQLSDSDPDSSSSLFGSMDPVNFTALGVSSALLGTNLGGTHPIGGGGESSSLGSSIIENVQSMLGNSAVSRGTLQYQETDADELNTQLKGTLQNAGKFFVEAGEKYQISPAFLAAVSMHETGNGTSNASRYKNNVAGMMGKNGLKSYDSVEESIFEMARNLRNNYLDEGKTTIAQIGAKYAPVGAANDPTGLNNHWVKGVQSYLDKMGKTDFS
jgi:hypothetical protein